MIPVYEYIVFEANGIIIVATTVIILIRLGRMGYGIKKNITKGMYLGAVFPAILYCIVGHPIETVGLIGIVVFLLTAIFGRIKTRS